MIARFFSSLALSPTQFTTFFLDGQSYFFFFLHSLIKSTYPAGKDYERKKKKKGKKRFFLFSLQVKVALNKFQIINVCFNIN